MQGVAEEWECAGARLLMDVLVQQGVLLQQNKAGTDALEHGVKMLSCSWH